MVREFYREHETAVLLTVALFGFPLLAGVQ
jgi:hypothetical protein